MDTNPNGEILETPDGSQPQIITADEGGQGDPNGALEPSPEEEAFNSLKGSTQERVRTLAKRANEATQLRSEVEQLRNEMAGLRLQRMTPQPAFNPEVNDAVSKLDSFGLATKDYVAQEIEKGVNQGLSGVVYKMELDRLEGKYNGNNGLPAFDRSEYETFIADNPKYRGYDPEDVYKKMFEDELFEARTKTPTTPTRLSPTLRATRTRVQEETMTPEYIEQRLKQPDGREWYDKNLSKINAVIARIPSTE